MAGNLISPNKYNEKIRDVVRDFYTYGWKKTEDMEKPPAGISADNQRLREAIIDESIQWYGWSGEVNRNRTLSLSMDAQTMKGNPFHRAFWFCTHSFNDIMYFLGTMLLLSKDTTLVEKVGEKDCCRSLFFDLDSEVTEPDFIQIENMYVKEKEKKHSLSNKALRLIFIGQNTKIPYAIKGALKDKNYVLDPENEFNTNTVRLHMEEWKKMGFTEKAAGLRKASEEREGEHWKLSKYYLRNLMQIGRGIDPQFDSHWKLLLTYYSRTFIFGEIGTAILRRLNWETDESLHVLDDYYMQSLSDFILFDILDAIEQEQWCLIRYKKAGEEAHLVKPIQVRISVANGRQHLISYNERNARMESLLISSISKIEVLGSFEAVRKIGSANGIEVPSEEETNKAIQKKTEELTNLWGVSLPAEKTDGKSIEHIEIAFCYNQETDGDFERQLRREKRCGHVTQEGERLLFRADITDGRELIPWIRKNYGQIEYVKGIDPKKYIASADVQSICEIFRKGLPKEMVLPGRTPDMDIREDYTVSVIPKTVKCQESTAHSFIFHECFSEEYAVASDWMVRILFSDKYRKQDVWSLKDFREVFYDVCEDLKYHVKENPRSGKNKAVERLFEELSEFVDETRLFRLLPGAKSIPGRSYQKMLSARSGKEEYNPGECSFYQDILPLSVTERKWLATILSDENCKLFLDSDTILALKNFIEMNNPFRMDKVVYYDRPKTEESEKEKGFIRSVFHAIQNRNKIGVISGSWQETRRCFGIPLYVEYSKRESMFRIVVASEDNDGCFMGVKAFLPGQIEEVIVSEEKYTEEDIKERCETKETQLELRICFIDAKNLAERLFTELAPWNRVSRKLKTKTTMYDALKEKNNLSDQFEIKVRYSEADMEKLVRILLAAGPYVCLEDTVPGRNGIGVAAEYKMRMLKQQEALQCNC
ncbi:MAG: WYL domain-containing protein [Lachnospiraceae bacterium]|nr:WYL domain-containing protein [Lachnospiraceae bacterium]